MQRKTISTLIIILGVVTAVTGAIAGPLAQASPTLSLILGTVGLAATSAAAALRHPPEVRQARRAARKHRRETSRQKNILGAIALFVSASVVLTNTGCGATPSRETLERLAGAGHTAESVVRAIQNLPDELFATNRLTMIARLALDNAISEALPALEQFNSAIDDALRSEKPDLKPLVPLAMRVIEQLHKLDRKDIPHWREAFAGAEFALGVLATYFAARLSEGRRAGLSDRQVCAAAGLPYDPELLRLVEQYAAPEVGDAGNAPAE